MTRHRDDKGSRDYSGWSDERDYRRDQERNEERTMGYKAERRGYPGGRYRERDYPDSTLEETRRGNGGREYGPEGRGREREAFDNESRREFRGPLGERARHEPGEPRYSGHSEGGNERQPNYDPREGEGRSLWEEGRDYLMGRSGYSHRQSPTSRSRIRCRDIMTRDVTVAALSTTLQEVARMMKEEDTGVIPVVDDNDASANAADTSEGRRVNTRMHGNGHLAGLITDRDIVVRAIADGRDVKTTRVEEVMTTDMHTAQPNDRVIDVIRKMSDKQVRRIPVIDSSGNLRGIISMADVALETEQDRELGEALEEISKGSSFWSKITG